MFKILRETLLLGNGEQMEAKDESQVNESPPDSQQLEVILTNSAVSEKIVSFLSFNDLKAASEVRRQFHKMIRGVGRFTQNAVLSVIRDLRVVKRILDKTTYRWKSLKVNLSLPVEVLNILPRIFESVEFVSLMDTKKCSRIPSPKLVNVIRQVLLSPGLLHLEIDAVLLESWNFIGCLQDNKSPSAAREIFKNLEKLNILGHNVLQSDASLIKRTHHYDKKAEALVTNLLKLAESTGQLESFQMTYDTFYGHRRNILNSVSTLIARNSDTLKDLGIIPQAGALIRELILPKLRSVKLVVRDPVVYSVTKFLDNHPQVEHLDILISGMTPLLLNSIQRLSRNLIKLNMEVNHFKGFERVDFSFLEEMERLNDFRIVGTGENCSGSFGTRDEFMLLLPKNQLERLTVISIYAWGWPMGKAKEEILQGFKCLRSLTVVNCGNLIDDRAMQIILREFEWLEELVLRNCPFLTDRGITGGDEGQLGVPLSNLRRLKKLVLYPKHRVTPHGLLSVAILPAMVTFDFITFDYDPVPNEFLLEIVDKIPRLMNIKVPYGSCLEKVRKQLKINGRNVEINDSAYLDQICIFLLRLPYERS